MSARRALRAGTRGAPLLAGTRYWADGWHEAGVTAGHRHAGGGDDTPSAGLKPLWLKALRPDAAVLQRGPLATLPSECRAAQPIATMGVLPVKLAQAESLFEAFARVPDPRTRNSRHPRARPDLVVTSPARPTARRPPPAPSTAKPAPTGSPKSSVPSRTKPAPPSTPGSRSKRNTKCPPASDRLAKSPAPSRLIDRQFPW